MVNSEHTIDLLAAIEEFKKGDKVYLDFPDHKEYGKVVTIERRCNVISRKWHVHLEVEGDLGNYGQDDYGSCISEKFLKPINKSTFSFTISAEQD